MIYINTERVVIKSWCNNPEETALEQARNLANLPFVFKQVNLMPDTHAGFGMPIGGVIGTKGVVIPNAVGVDIGCGMLAVQTTLMQLNKDTLQAIIKMIRATIPVGFNSHSAPQEQSYMPRVVCTVGGEDIVASQWTAARKQLGTLGGGNHFIEIQKGSDGYIWFMIHSGSRNLGYRVAQHHNDIAIELNRNWHSAVPKEHSLAFLPIVSEEGQNYLTEMKFCLDYARANRRLMAQRVEAAFSRFSGCLFTEEINVHHNYATMENHFGSNVMVHRKGATSAREGELGIIPGSQGTESYIVKGKGNKESFTSCSHGAGRTMSRTKAKETLDFDAEVKRLDDRGVLHSITSKKDLDEAASAYKDIDIVMEEQKDLVDIVVELTPLAVVKG